MKRIDQYKRKFEFIIEKLTRLPEDLDKDEFYKDALFYRLQVSIDTAMDIIAMLCKDLGLTVKDDYSNLDEIKKLKIFKSLDIQELRRWNGLRNILLHKYNKIEDSLVLQEKNNIIKSLQQLVVETEKIVNEKRGIIKSDKK